MKSIVKIVWLNALVLLAYSANAQLLLPKIIGHNMVLQRNQAVPVWGNAKAGDAVTVNFHQQTKKAIADQRGNWKLFLDKMPASSTPSDLTVAAGAQTIVLKNILVGEVWLCSGQSNMEYPMRKLIKTKMPDGVTDWPINEVAQANNSNLRIFLSERKKMNPDAWHRGWSVAADSALNTFSAVGYFFAKKLQEELKVPVGIISASIPGSRIEPWMPVEAFTALPFFQQQTDSTHKIDGDPGKFYTTMIEPIIPFALKGFLWYQGESNCFLNERLQYAYKMKALMEYWRKQWGGGDNMPFYYVQIAPFAYSKSSDSVKHYTSESLPEFWEVQQLALALPNTGMANIIDLNTSPSNLHPVNKWDVGKRLAFCALNKTYGFRDITPMGPAYKSMNIKGNEIELAFDYVGKGLEAKDGKPLLGFTIAGNDGKFVPANASVRNNKVVVSAGEIQKPMHVRFNWTEANISNLYNMDGLPAMPFRTDNPLTTQFK
ncbi:MAG TPA: sialate O-acetylesterase [Phnomibacter sp.]|nr:sialate O-acetylesterase [Phnomibacter sp.]